MEWKVLRELVMVVHARIIKATQELKQEDHSKFQVGEYLGEVSVLLKFT